MVLWLLLLLATRPDAQELPSSPAPAGPVSVANVTFEPSDLSVSYQQVVPLGVTYYKTQIVWRFSDGTSIAEPTELDWFEFYGVMNVRLGMPVNPLAAQTLVPTPASSLGRYVRKPKTPPPPGSVLIGAEVTVISLGSAALQMNCRSLSTQRSRPSHSGRASRHAWRSGNNISGVRSVPQDFGWLPSKPASPGPLSEHLATFWTLRGPSGRDLTCSAYHVETGLELRVEYNPQELVATELFRGVDADERLAAKADTGRLMLILKGFHEIEQI
jgi:hypothetical protein